MNGHAVADMGLSKDDLNDLVTSFNWLMTQAYDAILARGKFTWNQVCPPENLCDECV